MSIERISIRVERDTCRSGFRIACDANVRSVDGHGQFISVRTDSHLPEYAMETPAVFAIEVRRVVLDLLMHEVDEWLTFNGVRLSDPHSRESKQ